MIVEVADLWPKPSIRRIDCAKLSEGIPYQLILYIPLPRHARIPFLYSDVTDLPAASRRTASLVIIRAHPVEAGELLKSSEVIEELNPRFANRGFHLLTFSGQGYVLTRLPNTKQVEYQPSAEQLIRLLRQAELTTLLGRPGALLPAHSNFHYEAPNGLHYERFLRVGTTMHSIDTLDSILFWMLSDLLRTKLVLLDSGTILSLALRIQSYLAENGYTAESQNRSVECVRRYDEPVDELMCRVEYLNISQENHPSVLLIDSVTSSGKLLHRLSNACEEKGFQTRKLSIFSTEAYADKHPEESMAILDKTFVPHEKETCTLCRNRSQVIRILKDSYLLEWTAAVRETQLRYADALEARTFFRKYRGADCISIHKTAHDDRHHMIDIDVEALLKKASFTKKFKALCVKLGRGIDVVLHPDHQAATSMAARASEWLGAEPIKCEEHLLAKLAEDKLTKLKRAKGILILDDVLTTGKRMRGYKEALPDFINDKAQIRGLVGVARPANKDVFEAVRNMFGLRNNFDCVESLLLPDWDDKECPWCHEFRLLDKRTAKEKEIDWTPLIIKRKARLRRTKDGLKDDLFLHWKKSGPESWPLKQRPIYGPREMSQAELFAAIAHTLQVLRDRQRGDLDEQYTTPVAKVLKPEYYLVGRFYDRPLTACILRATRRHDLRAALIDVSLARAVNQRLSQGTSEGLRSEYLLAIAMDKLPRPDKKFFRTNRLLKGEKGVCSFLNRILHSDVSESRN